MTTSSIGSVKGGHDGDRRQRFGRLLAEALSARGAKQEDLARMLSTTQSSVSAWVTGRYEPSAETVFAIERTLALGPGYLSRVLGYLPLEAVVTAPGVEDAVAQCTVLDDAQKHIVLAVYQAVLQTKAGHAGHAGHHGQAPAATHRKRAMGSLPSRRRAQRQTG